MHASTAGPSLFGKHIVLGLSGGIACYKSAELVRALIKEGATVQVVMTDAAQQFITPITLQALSNQSVYTSQWDAREGNNMAHINLTRRASAVLVAPASADFLAKLLHGTADDLLSLLCLARPVATCPLLVAPAMNREMWEHPATQRNMTQLRQDGTILLGPASGEQACGEFGDGRMLEPQDLVADLIAFFTPKILQGIRVLITAGPTFEAIDPVRGITNLSSGKMGFAIARAAQEAGAQVCLVAGPVHLPTPRGVHRIDVQSAEQMHTAVMPLALEHEVFIATAAVADWRPVQAAAQKIKKNAKPHMSTLELTQNPDILASVSHLSHPPYCVGFAAETENLIENGREKLHRKRVSLVVANEGPATFGRDDNAVVLIDAHGERHLPQADKLSLARALVKDIAQRIAD
jgi:phosphopantothenoylcysteine decarboxylase / phosphopantothenate---cysteine ligase